MPSLTMTIAEIKIGKPGHIKGTDGAQIGLWPEKADLFQIGKTYEVEYTETEKNGRTYKNVKGAKDTGAPQTSPSLPLSSNGGSTNTYRRTDPADSERMFVCSILGSFIEAGQVTLDKEQLWNATKMLRLLWLHTFGPSGQLANGLAAQALVERDMNRKNGASDAYMAHNGQPVDYIPDHAH